MEAVQLYVWDLAHAPGPEFEWARAGMALQYKCFHSSVVVFDWEYSFSTDGICTDGNVVRIILVLLISGNVEPYSD